jgi:hypothetical protein
VDGDDGTLDDAPPAEVPETPEATEPPQAGETAEATETTDATDATAAEDPPPTTGDPAVDDATAEVAATAGEPLETRLAAYERAHRTLQDRLADVEG